MKGELMAYADPAEISDAIERIDEMITVVKSWINVFEPIKIMKPRGIDEALLSLHDGLADLKLDLEGLHLAASS
jgi:hypothetical protein